MQVAVAQRAVIGFFAFVFRFQLTHISSQPPSQGQTYLIGSTIRRFVVREAFAEYVFQLDRAHVSVFKCLGVIGLDGEERKCSTGLDVYY